MSIRIGIYGYGNLGRGVELALQQSPDMQPVAIFTRREPSSLVTATNTFSVHHVDEVADFRDKIDVMILCGGSATDLPTQTPMLATMFNVVDSFDTHAKIPQHFEAVDKAAAEAQHTALISVGWDPGLFSLNRVYAASVLPEGEDYTFWGKGVSQGHSDAVRRIAGVKNAKQYTIPVPAALESVRAGKAPTLTTRQKHTRECFVVAEEGADINRIEQEIINMPHYFADYDTTVHFIDEEAFLRDHSGIPHGGFVIRCGKTGLQKENTHVIEYQLKLDSNPEFTASVLVAYARAAARMNTIGQTGCKTVLDVPPAFLSPLSDEELRRTCL